MMEAVIIALTLSDEGYRLENLRDGISRSINIRLLEDGRIYIHCDSLNTGFYPDGDTLMMYVPDSSQPSLFEFKEERLVFTRDTSYYNGASFTEFPEWEYEYAPDGKRIRLNDSCSVNIKRIPRSEYIVRRWEMAHQQQKPYKKITDIGQARKMLGKRVTEIEIQEEDYTLRALEILFKDGVKKRFGGYIWEYSFMAYYPEIDVLVLEEEADGDGVIDLNDSNKYPVGNPSYDKVSPNGQWRLTGLYPGGAADGNEYYIEKWNPSKKRYEYIDTLMDTINSSFNFSYTEQWCWSAGGKALYINNSWNRPEYYEMEIIYSLSR